MHYEEMLTWLLFYTSLIDLKKIPAQDVADPGGLVRSQVIESEDGSLRVILNASQSQRTQSSRFLTEVFGSGVQHLAFATDDMLATVARLERNGVDLLEIRNSFRLGIGGERIPNKDFSSPWLDRIAYRLGFYYLSTYYRVNGEPINHWGVTGGLAVPVSGETRLNIALEYGSRGTTRNHLIKDNVFRMSFSLNLNELWFVQYEEE